LIQVIGNFGKYDVTCDRVINIAEGVFFVIDRTDEGPSTYIINILDQAQKMSFQCTRIGSDKNIQLNDRKGSVFWTGDKKANGEMQAWYFNLSVTD